MKLKGIDLSGSEPKALHALDGREYDKKIEERSQRNKKYAETRTKRRSMSRQLNQRRNIKRKGKNTYIDECLLHNEKYLKMSAIEQVNYKHELNKRLYSNNTNAAQPLKPIYDQFKVIEFNCLVIEHINEVLTPALFLAALTLATFTDKIDGRLRSSGRTLLSVSEIAEIIGAASRNAALSTLKKLQKAECIKMLPMRKSEFIEVAQYEAIKKKDMRKYILGLGYKEYAIYINPFFLFMRAYTDKDICEKFFYGSEWGLFNPRYLEIKKFIEEKCD